MAGFTSNSTARLLEAFDQVLAQQEQALAGLLRGNPRGTFAATRNHLGRARDAITATHNAVEQTLADVRIPADGRRKLIAEHLDRARETVRDATEDAKATLTILRAELTHAALPRLPDNRHDRADAERRLTTLLDRAGPDRLHDTVKTLAARDDALAATLNTRYGRDLIALADPQAGEALTAEIQAKALDAATRSDDPTRSGSANALATLGKLEGSTSGLALAVEHLAEDAPAAARQAETEAAVASNRGAYLAGIRAASGGDAA